jgi:hypothetical protein
MDGVSMVLRRLRKLKGSGEGRKKRRRRGKASAAKRHKAPFSEDLHSRLSDSKAAFEGSEMKGKGEKRKERSTFVLLLVLVS